MCIFISAHRLLWYARTLGAESILCQWWSIMSVFFPPNLCVFWPRRLNRPRSLLHLKPAFVVSQLLSYGVATISRLLQIIGLFCRITSLLLGSFAKETYHFKEPTQLSRNFWAMEWLRLVGSLKLHVSLKIIGLFCRALLQKRPIILRSLLIVATPYQKN